MAGKKPNNQRNYPIMLKHFFVNYCKSFRIPKLTFEIVTKAETFQFSYLLSNYTSTERFESINVGRSARAPFGCIRLYFVNFLNLN